MHWVVVLVLFGVTVGYMFLGAAVFRTLESDHEEETKTFSRTNVKEFLQNNTCVDPAELEALIRTVIAAYDQGALATNETETMDHWDLWSSFFFSATVISTIGYGHISPSTRGGRIFCIFYALVGIPLFGVLLAGIGQKLFYPIKKLRDKPNNKCAKLAISIVLAVFGIALLILLPAFAFYKFEDWDYYEGIYYAVITLTTVGFGDFVPGQEDKNYRASYQVLTIVWIFIGLSWLAIILTDIGDIFKEKIEKQEKYIKRKRSQMSSSSKEFDAVRAKRDSKV